MGKARERRRTLSDAERRRRERERERDDGSLRASRDCGHAAKERQQVGGERIRGGWNYFNTKDDGLNCSSSLKNPPKRYISLENC
jgi:hypothetical protein